ncbi:MAG: phenylacetate-CoA oxygenase subunit PaaI [Ignavibacteria bacterium]|nr:phenylacetate-CoA oxygenase subunit PaaI [Ignavibacteria bacterium]
MAEDNKDAIRNLIFRIADDQLIIGHRNSEWTGLGPILEEDIAFSSMAQDKLGHALALYTLLHEIGEKDPDTLAFNREEKDYVCCHFVEYPIGEYDFSLMRHFLFDSSEALRFGMLAESSFEPLAKIARKFRGELRYHKARMQSALNECMPLALGIFEPSDYELALQNEGIFPGEKFLQDAWIDHITPILNAGELRMPDVGNCTPSYGGRAGFHTEFLKPLIDEMSEVYKIDPKAEW